MKLNLSLVSHLETQDMTPTSQETMLSHSILESKYLVVLLGKKNKHFFPPGEESDCTEGAGVSQAAGIQTFRGSEGLFSQSSKRRSVLELFQSDTFEVRLLSPSPFMC
jgi:hypothetical protein